jgi:hypothetical protein
MTTRPTHVRVYVDFDIRTYLERGVDPDNINPEKLADLLRAVLDKHGPTRPLTYLVGGATLLYGKEGTKK